VHGEEVGLVAEIGDQRELVLDLIPELRADAIGPASADTLLGQRAQIPARGHARRHELLGILVAELFEGEVATRGDVDALLEELPGIEPGEALAAAETPFTVGIQIQARVRDGAAEADGAQGILQHSPRAAVHVHVPGRREGQARPRSQTPAGRETRPVVPAAEALHGEPRPGRKTLRHPAGLAEPHTRLGEIRLRQP
jgi:hypothetical protein